MSLIKKLIEEGKLKDISLPQGFVIPEGYINKLKEYIDIPDKNELVKGKYEIPASHGRIKIKITDLLSESLEIEVK